MKKFFQFMLVAVAAIALFSCTGKEKVKSLEKNSVTINVIAKADNLASDDIETKTYITTYNNVANTILWGSNEYMKLAVTPEGGATEFATSKDATANIFNGQPMATFGFEIAPADADAYTYQGFYPASAAVASNNTKIESYKINLIETQNATANSYDPAAYIMVAKPETFNEVKTDWLASYRRATALNKVTLKNLPAAVQEAGIKRVEITADVKDPQENTYLTGARRFDLTTGESGEIYSGSATVAVKYENHITGNANVDVWFTSWGVELSEGDGLVVAVYAGDKLYLRTITLGSGKSISFKEGYLNTLGVNMGGNDVIIANNTELEDGDYVVLANNNGTYYALKAEAENTRMGYESYTGSTTEYAGSDNSIIWTVSKSGDSYIFANDGNYLGWNSGNTAAMNEPGESWTPTNYLLDATFDNINSCYKVSVHSESSRILAKNTGSYGFAFYAGSGYNQIIFVPATVDNRTAVSLSFEESSIALTTEDFGNFYGQEVIVDPDIAAITDNLTWSYEGDEGVMADLEDGAVELSGSTGTVTVTVSFPGDNDYLPAEASYTITVSNNETGPVFAKVTSAPEDWCGEYLIVCETVGQALSSISTTSTKYGLGEGVTIDNGTIAIDAETSAYIIVIENASDGNGSYTMKLSGDYLGWFSGNSLSTASTESDNTRWTISAGVTSGNWIIANVADDTRMIWYNTGSPRFACYAGKNESSSGYAAIQLYALADSRDEAPMSWSEETGTATMTANGLSYNLPDLVFNSPAALPVTYASSAPAVATVDATTGSVTAVSEGTTTISATYDGSDATAPYKTTVKSYTLTVTDSRPTCAAPTFSPAAGEVTSGTTITIASATSGATIWYTTGSTEFSEGGWTEYTEPVAVTEACTIKAIAVKSNYKNSEVASAAYVITVATVGSGTEQDPYTAGDILDKYPNGSGDALVYVTGRITSITEVSLNYKNATYTISDGTRSILVYRGKYLDGEDFTSTDQIAVNDIVIVYGQIGTYNNAPQLANGNYLVSITKAPTITVDPKSLTWAADETDLRQITVTTSGNAGFTTDIVSGTYNDWTITTTGGTKLSVKPKEANTSTTADKVLVLKVKHNTDPSVFTEITCTQSKVSNGTPFSYTLDGTIFASGNAYATASTVTQNSIGWKVEGNTEQTPWRIGGKGITDQNRAIYSTDAIPADINQIKVGSGSVASSLTVNSLTITVHNSAADAASGANAIATKTVTSGIASATVTFDKEDNTSWAGKYYRIVYNVTRTTTSGNGYITFYSAQFNGTN